jgi:hypothetical protein
MMLTSFSVIALRMNRSIPSAFAIAPGSNACDYLEYVTPDWHGKT